MPFIDLNPTTQSGDSNPSSAATVVPTTPSPAPSTSQTDSDQSGGDLLDRLKSFTNFTKDELPPEGEKGLPALEDKQDVSDVTLNPQGPVATVDSSNIQPAQSSMPEVQEFTGPDFPTQVDDDDQAVQVDLDQKLSQVSNEMSNLVPEATSVAESSTPQVAPSPDQNTQPESETPAVNNDVSDDVVIGTEVAGLGEQSTLPAQTETVNTTENVPAEGVELASTALASTDTPSTDTRTADTSSTDTIQTDTASADTMQTDTASTDGSLSETAFVPMTPTDVTSAESTPVMVPTETIQTSQSSESQELLEQPVPEQDPVLPPMPTGPSLSPGTDGTVALGTPDTAVAQSLSDAQLQVKQYGLDEILKQALSLGASDVHLNVEYRAIARVDGDLTPLQSQVMTNEMIREMLVPVVAHKGDTPIDEIYDMDVAYSLPDKSARFRVNVYRHKENFAAVFRLIPEQIRTIEQLHLPALLHQFADLEQGLILVTGATGSGKSTTIAALVNEINQSHPKHIVTIEDPIEYIYPAGRAIISQRNVGEDTASWKDAMRSVLRQDPNVVVIGEMRDLETISAAMTIAETGHLVFATLHTNSAAQSVDRIIDVFPEFQQNQIRTQLANVLTAVVCQKLVPLSSGGRRVATEILLVNAAVRAAIREHKVYQIDNMIQTSADVGMISMEKSLFQLVKEGLISPEAAQQFANKPADLLTLMK